MALKSMSIERLTELREKVEAALKTKIIETRRTLEAELSKLSRVGLSGGRGPAPGKRYGAVAPKYRNSENPSETWAGRGLKPRWLAAALKAGHKIEEFQIGGAPKSTGTKTAKAKRGRKPVARKFPTPRGSAAGKTKAVRKPPARRKSSEPAASVQPEVSAQRA
jgi:DNA-binding protein H-NS